MSADGKLLVIHDQVPPIDASPECPQNPREGVFSQLVAYLEALNQ